MPIVNYEHRAMLAKQRLLANKKISEKNKELLKKFLDAYNVSPAREVIFFDKIKWLLERTDDIKRDMDNPDIINKIFKEIRALKTRQGKTIKEATYSTAISVANRFVRWVNDGDKPRGFKDISSNGLKKVKRVLSEDDMITEADGKRLINATNSIQLKAVIATQLDGGFRPSEFIDLKYSDIKQKDNFLIVRVMEGKTGPRNVTLWRSVPHLLRWLQNHPTKNPNDPLWLQEKKTQGKILKYDYFALQKVVKGIGEKIKLGKPLDFYNLRHSACTLSKLDNVPEELAANKFGHSIEFYTKTYGRISAQGEIERYSKHYGIQKENEKPQQNIKCKRCDFISGPGTELCEKCGAALSVKKALEIEKNKENEYQRMKQDIIKEIAQQLRAREKLEV